MKLKVAVSGSRTITDQRTIWRYFANLNGYLDHNIGAVITGIAPGVDTETKTWCDAVDIPCFRIKSLNKYYPKLWEKCGKLLYLGKDLQIIDDCDLLIAIWDGTSKGTKFTIDQALKRRKRVIVIHYSKTHSSKMIDHGIPK